MTGEIRTKFAGSWKLESISVKHNGHNLHPFGKQVKGILFYGAKQMSVQIMMPIHYPISSDRRTNIKLEGLAHSLKTAGYMGYWGTWQVKTENHTVIHKVEGSIAQPIVHKNEIRKYRFEHGKLILSIWPMELVWELID